ncbi:MAG: Rieske (2Fe-2S) protein [Nitriliruptorales bacterium]
MPVARLDDLLPGAKCTVEVAGRNVMLMRDDDGVYALEAFCSHAAGPLADGTLTSDHCIVCPWHGATFEARSGQVLRGPARKPLRSYRTLLEDGTVFIAL